MRTIAVPAGGGDAVVLDQPRHRAELGLRVRRGAHGRARRLDDAPRPERPHERRTPGSSARTGSGCIRSSSTTRRTTATARARRPARPATGGPRAARATATSSGASTWARTRARASEVSISYASDDLVQLTGRVRRRHRRLDRRRLDLVRGRRRTRSTAGRCPAPRRAARRTRTTGSSARRRTRPPPIGTVDRRSRSRASREILDFESSIFGPIRSRPPAGSSTTSGARLRAREPDAADLREGLLHRHRSAATR